MFWALRRKARRSRLRRPDFCFGSTGGGTESGTGTDAFCEGVETGMASGCGTGDASSSAESDRTTVDDEEDMVGEKEGVGDGGGDGRRQAKMIEMRECVVKKYEVDNGRNGQYLGQGNVENEDETQSVP